MDTLKRIRILLSFFIIVFLLYMVYIILSRRNAIRKQAEKDQIKALNAHFQKSVMKSLS